jgi:hypothetical protein
MDVSQLKLNDFVSLKDGATLRVVGISGTKVAVDDKTATKKLSDFKSKDKTDGCPFIKEYDKSDIEEIHSLRVGDKIGGCIVEGVDRKGALYAYQTNYGSPFSNFSSFTEWGATKNKSYGSAYFSHGFTKGKKTITSQFSNFKNFADINVGDFLVYGKDKRKIVYKTKAYAIVEDKSGMYTCSNSADLSKNAKACLVKNKKYSIVQDYQLSDYRVVKAVTPTKTEVVAAVPPPPPPPVAKARKEDWKLGDFTSVPNKDFIELRPILACLEGYFLVPDVDEDINEDGVTAHIKPLERYNNSATEGYREGEKANFRNQIQDALTFYKEKYGYDFSSSKCSWFKNIKVDAHVPPSSNFKVGDWVWNGSKVIQITAMYDTTLYFDEGGIECKDKFAKLYNVKTGMAASRCRLAKFTDLGFKVGDKLLCHPKDKESFTVTISKITDSEITSIGAGDRHYFDGSFGPFMSVKPTRVLPTVEVPPEAKRAQSTLEKNFQDSLYRIGARKLTKSIKDIILVSLKAHKTSVKTIKAMKSLLETDYGIAVVTTLASLALEQKDWKNSHVSKLITELRIDGMAIAIDAVINDLVTRKTKEDDTPISLQALPEEFAEEEIFSEQEEIFRRVAR